MKKFTRKFFSILLTLVMVISMVPAFGIAASAETEIHYQNYSGGTFSDETISTYTKITDSTTTWSGSTTNGWYVLTEDVSISSTVTVTGDVKLILCDGMHLTISPTSDNAGILVTGDNNSLTIYGQSGGTGSLIATGKTQGAGIGGATTQDGSYITINGGIITAVGGAAGGAGIGGGGNSMMKNPGSCHHITINGGTITASGGTTNANGIGVGIGQKNASAASNIIINTALVVNADNNNPPTTVITNTGNDLASFLSSKRFIAIKAPANVCKITACGDNPSLVDMQYTTISQAIDAADTNAATIQMIADYTENVKISSGRNITLDLNGQTITGTVTVEGNLTVKDSGEDGKICQEGASWIRAIGLTGENPIFTLKSGTLQATATDDNGVADTIEANAQNATINIEGGRVSASPPTSNNSDAIREISNTSHRTSVNISGGEFTGNLRLQNNDSKFNYTGHDTTLINTMLGAIGKTEITLDGVANFGSGDITVNSGKSIIINSTSKIIANTINNSGTIEIDMTDATDASVTLIDASSASDYGTAGTNYKFVDGKDNGYGLKVESNDLIAKKLVPTFNDRFGGTGLTKDSYTKDEVPTQDCHAKTEGYIFAGWSTAIDDVSKIIDTEPENDTIYYAVWKNTEGNVVVTASVDFKNHPDFAIPSGSNIAWNSDTKTVTLNHAAIDTMDQVGLNLPADSTVTISGINTVRAIGTGNTVNKKCVGIYSDQSGSLSINGSGTLNTYSGDLIGDCTVNVNFDRLSAGIYVNGDLTISGITLNAGSGKTDYQYEQYICGRSNGIFSTGKITIAAADVTAIAGDGTVSDKNGFSIGLHAYNNIEITNSTVKATSGYAKQDSDGIYAGHDFGLNTITAYGENDKYLANIIIKNSTVNAVSGTTTDYDTIGIYAHNSIYITDNSIVTAKNGGAAGSGSGGEARAAGIFRNEDLIIDHSTVNAEAYGHGIYTYTHVNEEDQGKTAVFGRTYIKNNSKVTSTCLDDGFALTSCNALSIADSTLECYTTTGNASIVFNDPNEDASNIEGLVITGSGKIITNGVMRVDVTGSGNPYYFGNATDKKYPVSGSEIKYLDGTTNIITPNAGSNMIITARQTSSGGGGGGGSSSTTVPVSGDKDTIKVTATVSGSNATVKNITAEEITKAGTGSSVAMDLSGLSKSVTGVTIPKTTFENIAASEATGLEIKMPNGTTVVFDKETLSAVAAQAKGANIQLVIDRDTKAESSMTSAQKETVKEMNNAVVLDAYFVSNGVRISDFKGGEAELTAEYSTDKAVKVWFVSEDGTKTEVPCTWDGKTAKFTVSHFSHYVIETVEGSEQESTTTEGSTFADVSSTDYFYEPVLWAAKNGITGGIDATHFAPNGITTRAQMVTFLWRHAGSPEPTAASCPFTDVDSSAYYYKAVLWAVEKGITEGTSATTFSPDVNVSRCQAVTFLWRYNGAIPFTNMTADGPAPSPFSDVATDAYYYSAVLWAKTQGITDGTSATTFSPDDDCTRGQIVTFLYRSVEK